MNSELGTYSEPGSGNAGNGGNISVSSYSGNITMNSSGLFSGSFTSSGNAGNAGKISFFSYLGDIILDNVHIESSSFTYSGNSANAGAVSLSSYSGNITVARPLWKSPSVSLALGDSGDGEQSLLRRILVILRLKKLEVFLGMLGLI